MPIVRVATFGALTMALVALAACESRPRPEPLPMPSSSAAAPAPSLRSRTVAAKRAPATHLVVLFHGFGADGTDLEPVARALAAALPAVDFVLPDGVEAAPGGSGRQWFSLAAVTPQNRAERVKKAADLVDTFVDGELSRRGLGPDRLVLAGFSQGAILAAWLSTHRANAPAALAMLSGRYADDGTARARVFPAFVGHGADDPVIPVAEAYTSASALAKLGVAVDEHVYPAMKHGISPDELRDVGAFLARVVSR